MPALTLFGYRTPAAGDDLHLLCCLYSALRLAEIGLAISLIVLAKREKDKFASGSMELICPEEVDYDEYSPFGRGFVAMTWVYVLVTLILAFTYIISDAMMVWKISDQGTPTQPEKRRKLAPLCSSRLLALGTIRIGLFVLGVLIGAALDDYCSCRVEYTESRRTLRFLEDASIIEAVRGCEREAYAFRLFVVLCICQFVEILLPFAAAGFICLREGRRVTKQATRRAGYTDESRWKCFCACCCNLTSLLTCCVCGGKEVNAGGYGDVAKALATFFDDGETLLDLVTTDILAGLVMLLRVQLQRRIECRKALIEASGDNNKKNRMTQAASHDDGIVEQGDNAGGKDCIIFRLERIGLEVCYTAALRKVLSSKNDADISAINEGARFCRLALGIYGWMMELIERPVTGCFVLGCSWCRHPSIHGCNSGKNGGIVGDNFLGCQKIALLNQGIEPNQIKYASFTQGVVKTPYCITVDEEWKYVVITIRGTLSLDDAVADLTIRPVLLDMWAERYGFQEEGTGEFCHKGMLDIAVWICEDLQSHGTLDQLLTGDNAEFSGYRLLVEGHSLGAGVAAVVATMLRSKYPSVRCLAFSPPGCVFSRHLSESSKHYVTSYVLGDDVVPRLGLTGVENLRHEVLSIFARIKVPKHIVLRPLSRHEDVIEANKRMLHGSSADIPPESAFWKAVQEFEEVQKIKKTEGGPDIGLFPPGNIIHLFRTTEDRRCLDLSCAFKKRPDNYVARYAEVDDLQEIIVSANALADHQPFTVLAELERVAESFGLMAPYSPTTSSSSTGIDSRESRGKDRKTSEA